MKSLSNKTLIATKQKLPIALFSREVLQVIKLTLNPRSLFWINPLDYYMNLGEDIKRYWNDSGLISIN